MKVIKRYHTKIQRCISKSVFEMSSKRSWAMTGNGTLFVFVFVAGALFFSTFLFSRYSSSVGFALKYPQALQCFFGNETKRYSCYRGKLLSVYSKHGVESAEAFLTSAYDLRNLTNNECHNLGHILGRKVITDGVTAEVALMFSLSKCSNGYTHGIIYALLGERLEHESNATIEDLTKLCNIQKIPGTCRHAVGHAMVSLYEDNIFTALGFCDNLFTEQKDRNECYDGAYMENVFGFYRQTVNRTQVLDDVQKKAEPLSLCAEVKEHQRLRCYFENMGVAATLLYKRGEIINFAEISKQVQRPYADVFWYGIGRASNTVFLGNTEVIKKICRTIAVPGDQYCYAGAARQMRLVEGRNSHVPQEFCDSLEETARKHCTKVLSWKEYPEAIIKKNRAL